MPGGKSQGAGPRPPVVAIFGKHPGWSDHITLPLETPALRHLWQMFYNTGIRSIIERGTWSQLNDAELIPFGHLFVTGQKRNWIVGRMWASADKVGRRDYPMVACVDFDDVSLAAAIDAAVPVLRTLESACHQATKSADVLSAMEFARTAMAGFKTEDRPVPATAVQTIKSHPALKDPNQLLLRLLWSWFDLLDRKLGRKLFSRQTTANALPVRVPMCAALPEAASKLWAEFSVEIAGPRYSIFVAVPDAQPWVDIMLGKPGPMDLAVLRRSGLSFETVTDLPDQEYSKSFQRWASAKLR
jgi:hypothetical protein